MKVKKVFSWLLIFILLSSMCTGIIPVLRLNTIIANASSIGENTYWTMNPDEAKGFIAFIYDTGKVSDDMMNAGNLYEFLTGEYERGSIEELCAKISFLVTAESNIAECINNYTVVMDHAYSDLLEYLIKQANGDIDDGFANSTLDSIVDSIKSIIFTLGNADETVLESLEYVYSAYSEISSIKEKVEKIKASLNAFHYVWSSANRAPYEYISAYINNFAIEEQLSDVDGVKSVIDSFMNIGTLDSSVCNGAILFYGNEDMVKQVESYGKYIYFVSKSLEEENVSANKSDVMKIMQVHCPTNVYLYDSKNKVLATVINDVVKIYSNNILISDNDSEKNIAYYGDSEISLRIVGSDFGKMDYKVTELLNSSVLRSVEYKNVTVEENMEYFSKIPKEVQVEADNYNLYKSDGTEIEYTYDSLPIVEDDAVNVTIAEELFDGFPKEIIDSVADTMFNMRSVVDLSSYDISPDDAVALFSAIAKYYPSEYSLITGGDFTYKIIVSPNLNRIMKIRFYYGDDANLNAYQKRVNDLNAEIDALVAKTKGMSDFEKALYIHDYIVLNSEYDLELLNYMEKNDSILPGELRSEKYTEYSILVNGTGVCGSYALAYRAVLNAAGMECLYLSSKEMNHAWNMVKIDGEWYHVDCCWDDPVPDTYGRAKRTYFLRTDEEIMNLNHRSWTPGKYKATSKRFSDMPRNSDRTQKYDDERWYYLSGGYLYSSDMYGGDEETILAITASSVDVNNNTIYCSNGRYIYEYTSDNLNGKLVYMLPNEDAGEKPYEAYISNFYIDNDNVEFYKSVYQDGKRVSILKNDLLQRDKYTDIKGIEISQSDVSLNLFETVKLVANIQSTSGLSNVEIEWFSDDSGIADVDSNGNVKACNVGSTKIGCRIGNYSALCNVTVKGDSLKGSCGDNVKWTFDAEEGIMHLTGLGRMSDYQYNNNLPPWYNFLPSIKYLEIEPGIQRISNYSFRGASNLINVTFPLSVTEIGYAAFDGCTSINKLIIPQSIKTLDQYCFKGCDSLKTVLLENGVETIAYEAFANCRQLQNINIPKSVSSLSPFAFGGCSSLESIDVDSENGRYYNDGGVLYDKDDASLMRCCPMSNVPETYFVDEGTKYVEVCAFENCANVSNVVLPNTMKELGHDSFSKCTGLKSITLPLSLTKLGYESFYGCNSLTSIEIPESVSEIKSNVFMDCKTLKYISIPKSVKVIDESSFVGCDNLKEIRVDKNSLYFSNNEYALFDKNQTKLIRAFPMCESTVINVPDTVEKIYPGAFDDCAKITHIYLPALSDIVIKSTTLNNRYFALGANNLMEIEVSVDNKNFSSLDGVLYDKNCADLIKYPANKANKIFTVPSGVKTISQYAFSSCKNLSTVYLDDSLSKIEFGAFEKCDKIRTITIPKDVELSNLFVFADCSNLQSLIINNDMGYNDIFSSLRALTKSCYKCDKTWVKGEVKFKTEYKSVFDTVFYCSKITNVPHDCDWINTSEIGDDHIHDYILSDYVEPTAEYDGYEYYECYCGESSYKNILHNFGEHIVTDPTCIEDGNKSATCTNCGATEIIETIPAIGKHDYKLVSTTPGDCLNAPVSHYTCTVCGDLYDKVEKIDDGHTYKDTVVKPTCTEKGYTKSLCEKCGETVISDFVSPLGHSMKITHSDAYCSAHDTLEYKCKRCGYTESVAADASKLETKTVVVEPTCTKSGSESEICVLCGATVSTKVLNPLSHKYSDEYMIDRPATCTTAGSKSQHCIRCDVKRDVMLIEATGHKHTSVFNAVEATCTQTGYTGDTFCSDCNSVIKNGTVTEKTVHSYVIAVTAPTCTTDGYTTHTCSVCGYSYTDNKTSDLGHTDSNSDGKCDRCGDTIYIPIENCKCACHKKGLAKFFFKIGLIFQKLFKKNRICKCGVWHY